MLSLPKLMAGPTLVEIDNRGPTVHEGVIKRSSVAADKLPLASDGIRLDEDSSQLTSVLDVGEVALLHYGGAGPSGPPRDAG